MYAYLQYTHIEEEHELSDYKQFHTLIQSVKRIAALKGIIFLTRIM